MQQNTPKKIESNLIESLLLAADSMESRRTQNRMLMAARIQDAMKAQKIGKKQLAEKLGKSPSLVTKYLSGTQNLTMDTLSDLEHILGVCFLRMEEESKIITTISTSSVGKVDFLKPHTTQKQKAMA